LPEQLRSHLIPPGRLERFYPKSDDGEAHRQTNVDVLDEAIELVLAIQNTVETKGGNNADRDFCEFKVHGLALPLSVLVQKANVSEYDGENHENQRCVKRGEVAHTAIEWL